RPVAARGGGRGQLGDPSRDARPRGRPRRGGAAGVAGELATVVLWQQRVGIEADEALDELGLAAAEAEVPRAEQVGKRGDRQRAVDGGALVGQRLRHGGPVVAPPQGEGGPAATKGAKAAAATAGEA